MKDTETKEKIEKKQFQAEVKQLLDIVIHSLYTDKEIFIRELVSNASDSLEKLRHLQLTEKDNIFDSKLDLEINIKTDEENNTVTISDYGIGFAKEDLVENLGKIAHSGTKKFLAALKENKNNTDNNLIGQFGVGFYSAFMVADEVKVYTHSWKKDTEHLCWTSDGENGYTIEETTDQKRGAKIVIKLKEEDKEFSKPDRIKSILEKYSSFVPFPINLNDEQINKVDAIWLKNKSEIKEEQYEEFYKFQAQAFESFHYKMHFSADAPINIKSLIFVPKRNPEIIGFGQSEPGVDLYCKKILIEAKSKKLLPEWLRFLKGVIDSEDLPLNISRESMQDSALISKINNVITKRFIKFLQKESQNNPENYEHFYTEFNKFIKEGVALDFTHRESLAKLLRFESSMTSDGKKTSLDEYISRANEDQKDIYYIINTNGKESIEKGPYLEAFKENNIEVLYLYEPIDEYVMNSLTEYSEKKLKSAVSSDVDFDKKDDADKDKKDDAEKDKDEKIDKLASWMKETLADKVESVVSSKRLKQSPAIILNQDDGMSPQMRQMMQASASKDSPGLKMKLNLEINPKHKVIKKLSDIYESKSEIAKKITEQIYQNSLINAGIFEDQTDMIDRIYDIIDEAMN